MTHQLPCFLFHRAERRYYYYTSYFRFLERKFEENGTPLGTSPLHLARISRLSEHTHTLSCFLSLLSTTWHSKYQTHTFSYIKTYFVEVSHESTQFGFSFSYLLVEVSVSFSFLFQALPRTHDICVYICC